MILIISIEADYSTNLVIRWLNFYKRPFIRINDTDSVTLDRLTHNDMVFVFKGREIRLNQIEAIWYRRGNFNINKFPLNFDYQGLLANYSKSELEIVSRYIHLLFKGKRHINNYNHHEVNKLEVLQMARERGLNKSEFLVTQSKAELKTFYHKQQKQIISKALKRPFVLLSEDMNYFSYTYKLSLEDINKMADHFPPTFFQRMIKKKYEIRSFYLKGEFFSMVIYSQNNSKTAIDFRHYDHNQPNRTAPYKLPTRYEEKMDELLKRLAIDCASIDTLVSLEQEYFMIDINPVGQFGMTSIPCNYNLEKKIANYLINER